MRKLTIGMATHDDYDGLYFSIQAIRMYHAEVLNDIEFVIIDNNPESNHGKLIRDLTNWIKEPFQYLPFTKYKSTSIRNKIFELADTPYVLSIDSHVLLEQGSLKKLIDFYDNRLDGGNLLQGPIIYDDVKSYSTHFDFTWRSHMWGTWQTDERGSDKNNDPFEIPSQGLGIFSCRKDSWLGFNKEFRGFGGEEGYIHEKYKKNGRKTLCLPFLRWLHRFNRPNGVTYPNNYEERFRNYMIGFNELNLPTKELKEHFKDVLSEDKQKDIENNVLELLNNS